jgi:hypothetical protein
MAIKKVVEIDVDVVRANGGLENFTRNFQKSEEAAKSLRTQLREAQLEVATLSEKFGATSKEAIEAAKKAAVLKDTIGDAKSLTDAFNPDAKFKALSGSLTGVAGGFSVVTGLMGTLGTESKEVEGAILKVQSAMAIASGAQAIGESVDQFKQLGAVVKSFTIVQRISAAAQMLWNAAMAANPIGAIVAVVVALIAAGYALVKMFIASSEATKKAEAANKALNKELETEVKNQKLANQEADLARDAQLKMAKASGQSAAEIRKLSLELANQEVAQKMANAQSLRAIAIEAIRKASVENASDELKETAKNALKEFNDANDALKTAVLNRRKLRIDNRVAEVQEETDAREKKKEADKKAGEEANKIAKELAAQKRKDELAEEKRLADERRKLFEDNIKKAFDLEKQLNESVETPAQKENREYLEKKAILENNYLSTEILDRQHKDRLQKIEDDANAIANERKVNDNNFKLEQERLFNEQLINAEIALQAAKRSALEQGLEMLQQFAGKNKALALTILAVQKGLAIADVINNAAKSIGTQTANTQAAHAGTKAFYAPFGPAGVVASTAQIVKNNLLLAKGVATTKLSAATSIAAILASGIQSATSGVGGGGAGGGGDAGGGGGAPAPPQFNIVGQSSTNQLSQTIAGQQNRPIQTYVVGSQVSTQQSLDRNAVANSTFG